MSSITKPAHQSSEPTAKKKFGKNLNKLTKPPAPPVTCSAKSSASSRNGLLLLSTKRPSGGNPASSSGAVSGILSSKPQASTKPLPSLGLQYESNTSTHDALLGAVVGASRYEAQQQPDAWGVAEKNQKGTSDEPRVSQMQGESFAENTTAEKSSTSPVSNTFAEDGHRFREVEYTQDRYDRYHRDNHNYGVPNGLLEDLGSRQHPADNNDFNFGGHDEIQQRDSTVEDVQGLYMSRAAQERAEKHRLEEEARIMKQKERSAQKLRELEDRMATAGHGDNANGNNPGQAKHPKFLLDKLDRSNKNADRGSPEPVPAMGGDRSSARTLFDPNRTYSSLVGGGAVQDKAIEVRSGDGDAVSRQRDGRAATEKGGQSPEASAAPYADASQYSRQVIHLASYEDRDRGERGGSAGPRMLYDPKSGSMVAVPNREDSGPSGRRKERGKKGRNGRDKEAKADAHATTDGSKAGRKGKSKKDENGAHRVKSAPDTSSASKTDVKKIRAVNSRRRLPRTCGVLYARDEKGNLFCADGCDGDLGYGAHSVPGGRNQNQPAYSQTTETQEVDEGALEDRHSDSSFMIDPRMQESGQGLILQTGFALVEPKETKMDWVKPNEKIVLVTGADDSPTLQATAKAWAPSQATLAAIVQEKPGVAVSVGSADDVDTDDDDAPVSFTSYLGL